MPLDVVCVSKHVSSQLLADLQSFDFFCDFLKKLAGTTNMVSREMLVYAVQKAYPLMFIGPIRDN